MKIHFYSLTKTRLFFTALVRKCFLLFHATAPFKMRVDKTTPTQGSAVMKCFDKKSFDFSFKVFDLLP